jgi:hypothetical protein
LSVDLLLLRVKCMPMLFRLPTSFRLPIVRGISESVFDDYRMCVTKTYSVTARERNISDLIFKAHFSMEFKSCLKVTQFGTGIKEEE